MKVRIVGCGDLQRDLLDGVVEILGRHKGPLEFVKQTPPIPLRQGPIPMDALFASIETYREKRRIGNDEYVALLTPQSNLENWFSSWNPAGAKGLFVHTGEWDQYVDCVSPAWPVAYQVAETVLQSRVDFSVLSFEEVFHSEPRGCMNDFCGWKPEISLKMRTGDICSDCLTLFNQNGIDPELIRQELAIFTEVRQAVLHSRDWIETPSDSDALPFPVAATRRKIAATVEPLRKFLFLLDHFDSLIRWSVLALGVALYRKGDSNGLAGFMGQQRLNERPPLGRWVGALKDLAGTVRRRGIPFPDLPEDLIDRIRSVVNVCSEERIVQLRNEQRGHGYFNIGNQEYSSTFQEFLPHVTAIERALLPVLGTLVPYTASSVSRQNGELFECKALALRGSHPDFCEESLTIRCPKVENVPVAGQVFLLQQPENVPLSMHPYVRYSKCPECAHYRMLVADGRKYLDPYVGHLVRLTD